MYKEEIIRNRAAWFRSIRPGDVSKGKFTECTALKSITVQLSDFNSLVGKRSGVYIHASYNKQELSVTLVGVTLEQREKEMMDPNFKNEWRKLIEK